MSSLVTIGSAHKSSPPRVRDGDFPPRYAEELARELGKRTSAEVRFDAASRALYATDGSNYRQTPVGVVIPRTIEDVVQTVALCREFDAPILARGGGTSLSGQCCNIAVVLDYSKYLKNIVHLDPERKLARVQPGIVLDRLQDVAERHHLTFGPDPATHTHCTLGGMIGNNSCGTHALMAGKTSDNIESLEVLTYDGHRFNVGATGDDELQAIIRVGGRKGEIYAKMLNLRDRYAQLIRERYPDIPRRVSGYNLDELLPENGFHVARALVGTECTCALVLEATLQLVHSPPARTLLVLGYPNIFLAADDVPELLPYGPIGLEAVDDFLVRNMQAKNMYPRQIAMLPPGNAWLLVEFGGETTAESEARAQRLLEALANRPQPPSFKLVRDPAEARMYWQVRESALGATAVVPGQPHLVEGWEDAAVRPDQLGLYLREFQGLYDKYGYQGALYGHFGQGCIHTRADFDLRSTEGIAKYRRYVTEAAHLVMKYGGSLSGEHGDGQSRAELLPIMFGPELVQAFEEFKAIWDPGNKLNPGKVVMPYKLDENLRYGTDYQDRRVTTHFQFPDDDGHFDHALTRCVGVGKCRRTDGGTMCPSYMATGEEAHSTRGRAHLLWELLQGPVLDDGWKNEAVKESLDLCLSCKGCQSDCPTQVDLATYKSEFLSHYYEGRLRPRHAYAVGYIHRWAQIASKLPAAANWMARQPWAKSLAGVAPEREMPQFASETFKAQFARRGHKNLEGRPVILWADTFSNYFHPPHATAAADVLEGLGYFVRVPKASLCCGRPLYDYGLLDDAKKALEQILETLGPAIDKGMPLVGIEPSCIAVFRDELRNLFPHSERARRLREQSFTLAEFLDAEGRLGELPRMTGRAVVHGHCHHKAVMKFDADQKVLSAVGLDYKVLDSGCCGMAGGFGFEKDHYEISMKIGERVLLPAVRAAADDDLILADGFSCQTQIVQATGRKALHLAEVLQLAMGQQQRPVPDSVSPLLQLAAPAAVAVAAAFYLTRARE